MIRIIVALLAVAAPAAAQNPSLSFDSGKSLPIATGQWVYVESATGSEARYGAHIVVRCDRTSRTVS